MGKNSNCVTQSSLLKDGHLPNTLVANQTICYCFLQKVKFLTNTSKQWRSPKHVGRRVSVLQKIRHFWLKKSPEHGHQDIPQSLHCMHCRDLLSFSHGCTANLCFVCFLVGIITSKGKINPSQRMSGNLWSDMTQLASCIK